jgi:hypothetical protein
MLRESRTWIASRSLSYPIPAFLPFWGLQEVVWVARGIPTGQSSRVRPSIRAPLALEGSGSWAKQRFAGVEVARVGADVGTRSGGVVTGVLAERRTRGRPTSARVAESLQPTQVPEAPKKEDRDRVSARLRIDPSSAAQNLARAARNSGADVEAVNDSQPSSQLDFTARCASSARRSHLCRRRC